MAEPVHRKQGPLQGIHPMHNYVFANTSDRTTFANEASGNPLNAGPPTASDIGRVARQTDTGTFWILANHSPVTWRQIDPAVPTSVSPFLFFGNGSVAATTTTRFLTPAYDHDLAQITAIQWRATRAGTLRNMRVRVNGPAGNGNAIVYTLRVNGVATSVTVSLASTSADGSDLVNTAAVAAGDLVDLQVTKAASVGTSPSDITASLEFA